MSLYDELKRISKAEDKSQINVALNTPPGGVVKKRVAYEKEDAISVLRITEASLAQSADEVYFLPWKEDAGLFLEIQKTDLSPTIFLTANLSGCFVGFRKDGDVLRICHYNFYDCEAKKGDFDLYTHWIAPNKIHLSEDGTRDIIGDKVKDLFNKGQKVTLYNNNPNTRQMFTTVFGLRDNNWVFENKWKFYLQDSTDSTNSKFQGSVI